MDFVNVTALRKLLNAADVSRGLSISLHNILKLVLTAYEIAMAERLSVVFTVQFPNNSDTTVKVDGAADRMDGPKVGLKEEWVENIWTDKIALNPHLNGVMNVIVIFLIIGKAVVVACEYCRRTPARPDVSAL